MGTHELAKRLACIAWAIAAGTACGGDDQTALYTDSQIRSLPQPLVDKIPIDELERMKEYVTRQRVKPETLSNSVYMGGDQFDCVFVERQPTIERMRDTGEDVTAVLDELENARKELQAGLRDDESLSKGLPPPRGVDPKSNRPIPLEGTQPIEEYCPPGTVPVRRVSLEEVAAYGTLDSYITSTQISPGGSSGGQRDYARVGRTTTISYGARAALNLWNMGDFRAGDQSISQIWVARGPRIGTTYDTVETGWRIYGAAPPYRSRLFVFFTNSNYSPNSANTNCTTQTCSCYNTACGFIQYDNTVFLDGIFTNTSVSGGAQYESTFALLKSGGNNGNWWMTYNGKWTGYWPRDVFLNIGLRNYADRLAWGGELYDSHSQYPTHTYSDMGGDGTYGSSPNAWTHAAYQQQLKTVDTAPGYFPAWTTPFVTSLATRPECYDIWVGTGDPISDTYFYFGGEGYGDHNNYACYYATP